MKNLSHLLGNSSALIAMLLITTAPEGKMSRTESLKNMFQLHRTSSCIHEEPLVSIITSVYKGDTFIKGFLEDMVRQTIFDECELIIINANSPGNEEPIILAYCKQYPNIIYLRLEKDPGLYAVWNIAIKMARGTYITNANIDDRRDPRCIERHALALIADHTSDLVYSDFYTTRIPNAIFEQSFLTERIIVKPFSVKNMRGCIVGPQPMWRKSLHEYAGYFDETFSSSGDWEFWLRIVSHGGRLKKVPGVSGVYYENPEGLSTNQNYTHTIRRAQEDQRIQQHYAYLWA